MLSQNVPRIRDDQQLEDLPLLLAVIDRATGRVQRVTRRLCRTIGCTASELIGQSLADLHVPAGSQEFDPWRGEGPFPRHGPLRVALRRLHKKALPVQVCCEAWPDREHSAAACVLWLPAPDASRSALQGDWSPESIFDDAKVILYVKDLAGRYLEVSRHFAQLLGADRRDLLGKTDYEIFPRAQAERIRANDQQVQRVQEPLEFEEILFPQPDGREAYLSVKFPIYDGQGTLFAIGGTSAKLTPRPGPEAALRASEQPFRQLAENMRECIWMAEVDTWRMLYVSPAYERIWGRSCQGGPSHSDVWLEAVHPADRQRVREAFFEQAIHGKYSEEYRIIRPDGAERWVWDRGVPIRDERGKVVRVAGIAEDITERKQLERQISHSISREQQRISGELHDGLGQQMTGIAYLAKKLARRLVSADESDARIAQEVADGVQQTLRELRRIVRGLAPVDLDEQGLVVALDQLATLTQERCRIPCSFSCDRHVTVEDNAVATHLYRIAQEALNNAIKHAKARRIEVGLHQIDDSLTLAVRDDGCGMPHSHRSAGMGMDIMQYRCGIIGARLDVESTPGVGTAVICVLKRKS